MMQLKQLEVFVHVARLKSFSKAADALYLTQPTISAHVSALEGELGTKLVVRSTKEIQLTATGNILFGYATQILGLCERAEQEVKNASSDIQGALSIAASTVPSQYLLPRILPHLRRRYPKVFFQVFQGDPVRWPSGSLKTARSWASSAPRCRRRAVSVRRFSRSAW